MPEPVIGILGGMGPQAGIDLATKITQQTEAAFDQDHCPVVLFSKPGTIPDRTKFLLGHSSADPAAPIADALLSMARAGVSIAAIACNTAHADPIDRAVRTRIAAEAPQLRLLNMIEETVASIQATLPEISTVGILGTQGTYRFRLYEKRLEKAGYTCLIPSASEREGLLHDAIYDPEYGIKADARAVSEQARKNIRQVVRTLQKRGAEAVVLGCTEIPLAVPESHMAGLPLVDPTREVARSLIREAFPDRLRPRTVHQSPSNALR